MNETAQLLGTLTAIPLVLFLAALIVGGLVIGYKKVKHAFGKPSKRRLGSASELPY